MRRHHYAIVLAGGEGTRLARLAKVLHGYARPKQYCRFGSGETLLEETLRRASRFVPDASHIVVSTVRSHRAEADECLVDWPSVRRIEQPRGRDTTPGILLPLAHILEWDADAVVLVLPSDHHFSDDEGVIRAVLGASLELESCPERVLLAGARLDAPDEGLGWIVPGAGFGAWRRVRRFVEKPSMSEADALHRIGALANTFVMLARADALAALARRHAANWWEALSNALGDPAALADVYETNTASSFSRDVLSAAADSLGVVPLRGVGWSDIGTPERLRRARGVPLQEVA